MALNKDNLKHNLEIADEELDEMEDYYYEKEKFKDDNSIAFFVVIILFAIIGLLYIWLV